MIFITTNTKEKFMNIINSNEKYRKAYEAKLIERLPTEDKLVVLRIRGILFPNIIEYDSLSNDVKELIKPQNPLWYHLEDLEDRIKICKRCGKVYDNEYDFVEDPELLEAINRYINVDVYCSSCIEEMDDEIYEFCRK